MSRRSSRRRSNRDLIECEVILDDSMMIDTLPDRDNTPEEVLDDIPVPEELEESEIDLLVGYIRLLIQEEAEQDNLGCALYNVLSVNEFDNDNFIKTCTNAVAILQGLLIEEDIEIPDDEVLEEAASLSMSLVRAKFIKAALDEGEDIYLEGYRDNELDKIEDAALEAQDLMKVRRGRRSRYDDDRGGRRTSGSRGRSSRHGRATNTGTVRPAQYSQHRSGGHRRNKRKGTKAVRSARAIASEQQRGKSQPQKRERTQAKRHGMSSATRNTQAVKGNDTVSVKRNARSVGAAHREKDHIGDGPTEAYVMGGSKPIHQERVEETQMVNDTATYDRRNRRLSTQEGRVRTTQLNTDKPADTRNMEVPTCAEDIVIDPTYVRAKPEGFNEDRPYDVFLNPGDIVVYARQVYLATKPNLNVPLAAFNPYTKMGFVAVTPEGKIFDIVVDQTPDMDYLRHELRTQLVEAKRITNEGTIISDTDIPTYRKQVPTKAKADLTNEEVEDLVQDTESGYSTNPLAALPAAERNIYRDHKEHKPNFLYTTVDINVVDVVGKDAAVALQGLAEINTFEALATALVDMRNDNVISPAAFRHLDATLVGIVNNMLKHVYAIDGSLTGAFVDDVHEVKPALEQLYGELGIKHYEAYQKHVISSVFLYTINQGDEELNEDESEAEEIAKEIAGETNGDNAEVTNDTLANALKELAVEENDDIQLYNEISTVNFRTNLTGNIFANMRKGFAEVLPNAEYPVLQSTLARLLKMVVHEKMLYANLVTKDGVVFRVSPGIGLNTVLLARLN